MRLLAGVQVVRSWGTSLYTGGPQEEVGNLCDVKEGIVPLPKVASYFLTFGSPR